VSDDAGLFLGRSDRLRLFHLGFALLLDHLFPPEPGFREKPKIVSKARDFKGFPDDCQLKTGKVRSARTVLSDAAALSLQRASSACISETILRTARALLGQLTFLQTIAERLYFAIFSFDFKAPQGVLQGTRACRRLR
jgi:hypothetical protein